MTKTSPHRLKFLFFLFCTAGGGRLTRLLWTNQSINQSIVRFVGWVGEPTSRLASSSFCSFLSRVARQGKERKEKEFQFELWIITWKKERYEEKKGFFKRHDLVESFLALASPLPSANKCCCLCAVQVLPDELRIWTCGLDECMHSAQYGTFILLLSPFTFQESIVVVVSSLFSCLPLTHWLRACVRAGINL